MWTITKVEGAEHFASDYIEGIGPMQLAEAKIGATKTANVLFLLHQDLKVVR